MAVFVRYAETTAGVTWAGQTLAVDVGVHPTETWTYNTDLNQSMTSGYDFAEDFVSWFNDAGRAWTGAETMTVSYVGFDDSEIRNTNQMGIKFTCSTSIDWTVSSGLTTLTGLASASVASTLTSTAACLGSVGALWGVMAWDKSNRSDGKVTGDGGYLAGGAATSARRPAIAAVLTPGQVVALADARMLVRGGWRQMHIYQEHTSTWRLASVGRIRPPRRIGPTLYHVRLGALG